MAEQPSPSLELRAFDAEFFAKIQRGLVEVLCLDHAGELPAVFKVPVAVALADNIAMQLCSQYSIDPNHERAHRLTGLLESYVRSVQYHYAMLKGEAKFDADLRKVQPISDVERAEWRRRFDHLKLQQKRGNRKAALSNMQKKFSRL
jgi:hypothetical protein